MPVSRARTQSSASTAPAAPSRWPVMLFVDETGSASAAAPNTARIARASLRSPAGVLVAWAFT